jgi:hypothetical protein
LVDSVAFLTVTNTSPTGTLTVAGTVSATTLTETSTQASKTDIRPLVPPHLSKLMQLTPVYFKYKNTGDESIGFIAEEMLKIYPEFVSYNSDGKIDGINYTKLTAVLVQGIKELVTIVDKQQNQIDIINNKLGL